MSEYGENVLAIAVTTTPTGTPRRIPGVMSPRTYSAPEAAVSVIGSTTPSSPSGLSANTAPASHGRTSATAGAAIVSIESKELPKSDDPTAMTGIKT